MSKNAKRLIIVFVIVFLLLLISLLLSVYAFKPTVTLDMGYVKFDRNFYITRSGGEPIIQANDADYKIVTRFSHYEPPVLSRTGYTFAGWYRDIGYTVAWINGRDTVTKDITLYAKWIKNT
jgi:uncharacterized repeat protein (TIGR02543 family)